MFVDFISVSFTTMDLINWNKNLPLNNFFVQGIVLSSEQGPKAFFLEIASSRSPGTRLQEKFFQLKENEK